jgi:preprotein translocase subunit SecY
MKKVLEIISWTLFFIAAIASVAAAVCTIGGVVTLVLALCITKVAPIFAYFAIGYFGSVTVLVLVAIIYSIYECVRKARAPKE